MDDNNMNPYGGNPYAGEPKVDNPFTGDMGTPFGGDMGNPYAGNPTVENPYESNPYAADSGLGSTGDYNQINNESMTDNPYDNTSMDMSNNTYAAPNETFASDTPVNDTPVNDTLSNDTPGAPSDDTYSSSLDNVYNGPASASNDINNEPTPMNPYGSQDPMNPYGNPAQNPYGGPAPTTGPSPSNPYGGPTPNPGNAYGAPTPGMPYGNGGSATGGNTYTGPSPSNPYGGPVQGNAYGGPQVNSYGSNSWDIQPEDGKATIGLILSICSLIICCLGLVLAPVGMVFSKQAINAGNTSTKAKAGWIIGIIGLVLNVLLVIMAIVGSFLD